MTYNNHYEGTVGVRFELHEGGTMEYGTTSV